MEDGRRRTLDFKDFLRTFGRKSWLLCVCFAVTFGISFLTFQYLIAPVYTASVFLYVTNTQEREAELNAGDLDTSQKLVNTCVVILQKERVAERVNRRLGGRYTTKELQEMVHMGAVNRTEILKISASAPDAKEAAEICDAFADSAPGEILRVVKAGTVEVLDAAVVPEEPSFPQVFPDSLLVAFLMTCLVVVGMVVWYMLDTHVHTAEELAVLYNIPVLAEISEAGCLREGKYHEI